MKTKIVIEEWYPVYELTPESYGYDTEIPEDKVEWISRVFNEFREVQGYLKENHDVAYKNFLKNPENS
jgi:hypothetical protein